MGENVLKPTPDELFQEIKKRRRSRYASGKTIEPALAVDEKPADKPKNIPIQKPEENEEIEKLQDQARKKNNFRPRR